MRAYWLNAQEDSYLPVHELTSNGVTYVHVSLESHREFLDTVKRDYGYVAEDVVELGPHTPGLTEILARFDREHRHSDDEVRYILEGSGIFDIRSTGDCWMRVSVGPGDFIIVPKERHHLFSMPDGVTIKAIRLFRDQAGWIPTYR